MCTTVTRSFSAQENMQLANQSKALLATTGSYLFRSRPESKSILRLRTCSFKGSATQSRMSDTLNPWSDLFHLPVALCISSCSEIEVENLDVT